MSEINLSISIACVVGDKQQETLSGKSLIHVHIISGPTICQDKYWLFS